MYSVHFLYFRLGRGVLCFEIWFPSTQSALFWVVKFHLIHLGPSWLNLQKFSTRENFLNELRYGCLFLMDYNEDRQVTFNLGDNKVKDKGLISRIIKYNNLHQAVININTISMYIEYYRCIFNIKLHASNFTFKNLQNP